jgi:hypothetical protein
MHSVLSAARISVVRLSVVALKIFHSTKRINERSTYWLEGEGREKGERKERERRERERESGF